MLQQHQKATQKPFNVRHHSPVLYLEPRIGHKNPMNCTCRGNHGGMLLLSTSQGMISGYQDLNDFQHHLQTTENGIVESELQLIPQL